MNKENKKVDNVNHPQHYEGNCSLECIEVMIIIFGEEAVIDFCLCCAFKYLWRYKNKNGEEDLSKAKWYLKYVSDKCYDDECFRKFISLQKLYEKIISGR